nr:MAG TPA: hypothetical protein [Caudoviricetes sp.]
MKKNNNFFDVRNIFYEQFKMFDKAKGQIIVFYVVPAILAYATTKNKYIDKDIIDNIIIVMSIILSMLFAMLSIINGYQKSDPKYTKVLDETNNSIMFQSVLCVITLIVSFAQFFVGDYSGEKAIIVVSFVLYYFVFVIILNTFVVLKRMKALYDNR